MGEIYDVAIIGGGPAGSTAATLLARAGRSVLLLERDKFPRFHIGESLLPSSMPILERLGVRERLDQTFHKKHGVEVITACAERHVKFYFKNGFRLKHTVSYQVERAVFDQLLLENSAAHGAEVREETTVERVTLESAGASLQLRSAIGQEIIRARYLIDASGRNALLGSQLKLQQKCADLHKFSVSAHYENVRRDLGSDSTLTRIVRGDDRWFWMIPLSDTRMSIGLVMDNADLKKLEQEPEAALTTALRDQPVIRGWMENATRLSAVASTDDYSYRNSSLSGSCWLLAGDAAGSIDPVFSSGVYLALVSGEAAADAIHEVLSSPKKQRKLFGAYEKKLNRVMDLYLRLGFSWERHEFVEVLSQATERFGVASAITAVLAGNLEGAFALWWRMRLFHLLVLIQRFYPIFPRLGLRAQPSNVSHPCLS